MKKMVFRDAVGFSLENNDYRFLWVEERNRRRYRLRANPSLA